MRSLHVGMKAQNMKVIDKMKELIWDERIYPIDIIKMAINNYSEISKISFFFCVDVHKVKLSFEDLKIDFDIVKNEFCNHLIELIAVVRGESEQF